MQAPHTSCAELRGAHSMVAARARAYARGAGAYCWSVAGAVVAEIKSISLISPCDSRAQKIETHIAVLQTAQHINSGAQWHCHSTLGRLPASDGCVHGREVAQADPRARRPGGSFRQQSNVNLGVVEAHRKVPQGRGARWATSYITRGLGHASQTTLDSVVLDTVATLAPKHARMDDFCS